ncbi:SCP2 sterol-binding domain-containing protein [Ktedonosporobacter rubrisoli]|uniref:SCP2 sterol-binding domain-containing protein n=1 Tax=Ktedonosporobacter rubrisoli TaxID=2509675 RepID=A0A4P6JQG3_KTERU|nr:SCP2 sterol-binding domain-containing protein [Ktedonosporobacter rubrisoli]QBD77410.1 SCP2 sterol-binding domain-containing protein [Ktedonosporobacter rubrisoli]
MEDIVPYLEQICARFEHSETRSLFRGFTKTVQFSFSDLQRDFTLSIAEDGSAALIERTVSQPDVKIIISSDILAGILNSTVNPIQAYITRKLAVAGQIEDLLKLQKLF